MSLSILAESIILTSVLVIAGILMNQKNSVEYYFFDFIFSCAVLRAIEGSNSYSKFGMLESVSKDFIPHDMQHEILELFSFSFDRTLTIDQKNDFIFRV